MKLMQQTKGMFGGTDPWVKAEWALGFLSLASGCFAISVVPFIRKDFGERYLGWLNLFFGYTVVANFTFLGALIGSLGGMFVRTQSASPQLMMLFWLAFIAASIYHRREIARKNRAGEEWHSMYMGTSILPLPFSRETVYKFAEPGLVFGAGYLVSSVSFQVGLWLMISAASLFVNNHIIYYQQRQSILDMRDAEIEAHFMSAALAGGPPSETCGLVVAESNIALVHSDAGLKAAFAALSPELKDVLDAESDDTHASPESGR